MYFQEDKTFTSVTKDKKDLKIKWGYNKRSKVLKNTKLVEDHLQFIHVQTSNMKWNGLIPYCITMDEIVPLYQLTDHLICNKNETGLEIILLLVAIKSKK